MKGFITPRRLFTRLVTGLSTAVIMACTGPQERIASALSSEDYVAAERLLQVQAQKDDPAALYNLGNIHRNGLTGQRDYRRAAGYFLRAATQGQPDAQVAIGELYAAGEGVVQDTDEALAWYLRAAHQGSAEAQYRVAHTYEHELGVAAQPEAAARWYRLAAAQGHAAAQQHVLHAAKTVQRPRTDVSPQFAVADLSKLLVAGLAQSDLLARDAKARLNGLTVVTAAHKAARRTYEDLAAQVTHQRDRAWAAVAVSRVRPTFIKDPLTLSMLDLHIEVRRALGPNHHTYVPGLVADPGCAGDIVAERLIFVYGQAALQRSQPLTDAVPADVAALRDIAAQIACLSVRQLAELERAINQGAQVVSRRMLAHDLGGLVPAFDRLVAPIQVLILDARKHRGEASSAWQWFYQRGPLLRVAVARSGWGSDGNIYLWDRLSASLLGFPTCATGATVSGCIDLPAFIDSLSDPRTLGLGDCALAGMLAHGQSQFGQDLRYACPWQPCNGSGNNDDRTDTAGAATASARAEVEQRWPSFPNAGEEPQTTDGAPCLSQGGFQFQGGERDRTSCIDELFKRSDNPWDTYASCMTEELTGEPQLLGQLPGAPMGNQCKLAQSAATSPFRNQVWDEDAGEYRGPKLGEIPRVLTSGTSPTRQELDRKKQHEQAQQQKQTKEEAQKEQQKKEEKKQEEMKQTEKNNAEKDPKKRKGGAAGSCVDAVDCSESCTGLGAQVGQAQRCTEDLLNAFGDALGRPRRGPTPGQVIPPIIFVVNYHPDDAPAEMSKPNVCLHGSGSGQGGGHGTPSPCRLMLCPDTALGAVTRGEACSCGGNQQAFRPVRALCPRIHCTQGQILTDDCRCEDFGVDSGQPPPGRPPVGRRSLPGNLDSR